MKGIVSTAAPVAVAAATAVTMDWKIERQPMKINDIICAYKYTIVRCADAIVCINLFALNAAYLRQIKP